MNRLGMWAPCLRTTKTWGPVSRVESGVVAVSSGDGREDVENCSSSAFIVFLSTNSYFFYFAPLFVLAPGLVGAPACGDVMKLQIRVNDDGTIEESKFKTFGCGSAIASSSVATEWIKGKSIDEVVKIKNTDIAAHLKLPPVKLHCSMLAEDAIKAAVNDWKAKQEKKKQEAA